MFIKETLRNIEKKGGGRVNDIKSVSILVLPVSQGMIDELLRLHYINYNYRKPLVTETKGNYLQIKSLNNPFSSILKTNATPSIR